MRVVGSKDRNEFELDPVRALRRALDMDRKLRLIVGPPRPRGVFRATHAEFNRIDDARRVDIARLVNAS
ncbi:MAG: hypothetical protein ACKVQQ_18495 [Burkholderiales bacterium]